MVVSALCHVLFLQGLLCERTSPLAWPQELKDLDSKLSGARPRIDIYADSVLVWHGWPRRPFSLPIRSPTYSPRPHRSPGPR